MKEPCFDCNGTGKIKCQACGGTGVLPNASVLDADCLERKGSGRERHQLCRGTGFISADVTPLPAARPLSQQLVRSAGQSLPTVT